MDLLIPRSGHPKFGGLLGKHSARRCGSDPPAVHGGTSERVAATRRCCEKQRLKNRALSRTVRSDQNRERSEAGDLAVRDPAVVLDLQLLDHASGLSSPTAECKFRSVKFADRAAKKFMPH